MVLLLVMCFYETAEPVPAVFYRLILDSALFANMIGEVSATETISLKIKSLEVYAKLILHLHGTYYLRLFCDEDGNGKWSAGKYVKHRQPEEVFYFPFDI